MFASGTIGFRLSLTPGASPPDRIFARELPHMPSIEWLHCRIKKGIAQRVPARYIINAYVSKD